MIANGRRSRFKVEGLPAEIKSEVDARLVAGATYESVSDFINSKGYSITFQSVGRYGQKYLKAFESVRIAREFSKALVQDNIDRPATEIHEANNLLANQIVMEMLMDGDMESDEKIKLMNALAQLQKAQAQNEKLKIDAIKAAGPVRSAMNTLRDKVFETLSEKYPEAAQTILSIADAVESEAKQL